MIRTMIGAVGVVVGGFGAYLLLSRQDFAQLTNVGLWLVSGVVLHDFVLTPIVIVLVVIAARLLPISARGPAAVGLIILGTVSIVAIPVLTGLGRRADNATLLDRSYGAGWLGFFVVTLLAVVVASVIRARHRPGRHAHAERSANGVGRSRETAP